MDPDRIFSEVQSCDLDRVFEQSRSRHRPRGSTGNWLPDRLTDRERQQYRKDMGFDALQAAARDAAAKKEKGQGGP